MVAMLGLNTHSNSRVPKIISAEQPLLEEEHSVWHSICHSLCVSLLHQIYVQDKQLTYIGNKTSPLDPDSMLFHQLKYLPLSSRCSTSLESMIRCHQCSMCWKSPAKCYPLLCETLPELKPHQMASVYICRILCVC